MRRVARNTFCAFFMWLPEPRSSPAPHFEGQRWLSGGTFQPCAAAISGVKSSAASVADALRFMGLPFEVACLCYAVELEFEQPLGVGAADLHAVGRADRA